MKRASSSRCSAAQPRGRSWRAQQGHLHGIEIGVEFITALARRW
jgi:hypothetical protein